MKFIHHSKAAVLQKIEDEVTFFKVPKLVSINCMLYQKDKSSIDSKIKTLEYSPLLVVRSSAADEDGSASSSAGEYDSFLNIPFNCAEKITESIDNVISSYEKKRPLLEQDEVIIQQMVENTTMSGVIFTHDLNTGAPYYVINYDDQSGLTDTVTSGAGEYSNRTLFIHRGSTEEIRSDRFTKLLQAVKELELIMQSEFLDIEFAIGRDLKPYLLQVRAITTQANWNRAITKRIDETLLKMQSFVVDRFTRSSNAYGQTTILGQMPDWNPIEMIGRAPRALAASLYQTLITDLAWSRAREEMGYTVPVGQPLMVMLAGQPFIDVQLSFHSFLPKTLSPNIASKLVDHWINQLKKSPELHDKVEFDVAITTFSFDMDDKIECLIGDILTGHEKQEFKQAHLAQALRLIKGEDSGSLGNALENIKTLKARQTSLAKNDGGTNITYLHTMISDCITFGTVPFSILARHGFIAKTILLSLCHIGILTKNEIDQFQTTIRTVASDLVSDMRRLQLGEITNDNFMLRFGHLRPGTYDILSPRYDQMGEVLSNAEYPNSEISLEPFRLPQMKLDKIDKLLLDSGFGDFKAGDLLGYMRDATVAREYGKFVFTRSVSDILELIADFSCENGLSRDEISHVPLNSILEVLSSSGEKSIEEFLRDLSDSGKVKHQISSAIRLPQLLVVQSDIHVVPFQVSHPNFITTKAVTGKCLMLTSDMKEVSLEGKIVLIEGADPGFDWIFSQNIIGLITKYGGANSHMAIRSAEFDIPAAIGCGEQRFDRLLQSNNVHLDCSAGLINPLN